MPGLAAAVSVAWLPSPTLYVKSLATLVPPLSLVTALITVRVPVGMRSTNVHVVIRPDSIVMLLIVLVVVLSAPPVEPPPDFTHEALLSAQGDGMVVSPTDALVVTVSGMAVAVPLPAIDRVTAPGLAVNPNVGLVTPVPASLVMTRKPPPGLTMQSNGLLLPPLPADGYEQTLTRTSVPGMTDLRIRASTVLSWGCCRRPPGTGRYR